MDRLFTVRASNGLTPASLLSRDPRSINAMFSGIAARYDLMNKLMTFGLDARWRRAAALAAAPAAGTRALDACCGTGDLTLALAELFPGAEVVGADFTEAMLVRAREKAARRSSRSGYAPPLFVAGDLLQLPFADGEFSTVTVGWGVRNVPDLPRAFAEMRRVVQPGGRVVCLESTRPSPGPLRPFQLLWMAHAIPLLGRLVGGDPGAYAYLPASVEAFPDADGLAALMGEAGLVRVRYRRFSVGSVALHVGEVPT